jgi:hypothetical protein
MSPRTRKNSNLLSGYMVQSGVLSLACGILLIAVGAVQGKVGLIIFGVFILLFIPAFTYVFLRSWDRFTARRSRTRP